MKLGRLPARRDPNLPSLARYTRGLIIPPPPPSVDYYSKITNWPMDLNDSIGDCTAAAVSHAIQQWTTYAKPVPTIMTDAQVLSLYETVSGYNPAIPSTDVGATVTGILHHWLNSGVDGNKLTSYCAANIASQKEIKDTINWFGNCYIGFNCPQSALDNTKVWDLVPGSPIAGGHAVIIAGYDANYFYCVSWGMLIPATPAFIFTYLEEAFALVDVDFVMANGKAPNGLDLAQMSADLSLIRHHKVH